VAIIDHPFDETPYLDYEDYEKSAFKNTFFHSIEDIDDGLSTAIWIT